MALLKRVFGVDVLPCSRSGGGRRTVAVHTRPQTLRPLLERLGRDVPAPSVTPSVPHATLLQEGGDIDGEKASS